MEFNNLKVELRAYHKLDPNIFNNYVSKEDLEDKLKDYVKDIEDPVEDKVYGRAEIDGSKKWVDINKE